MTRKTVRQLTDEDRVLWRRITDTITPIGRRDRISRAEFAALLESENGRPETSGSRAGSRAGQNLFRPSAPVSPPKPRISIDRPVRYKISKGRIQLDARIDLHGMTQHQAHSMLLNFLHQAWQHRLRHVLVITGKGSSLGSEGVLSRAVPEWFATPPFHSLVSGYAFAARQHGGHGALYVRLRRQKEGRKS
jgi:DNA-nicking Smr family endonuclease